MAKDGGAPRGYLSLVSGIVAVLGLLAAGLLSWLLVVRLSQGNVDGAMPAALGLIGVALVLVVWFTAVAIMNMLGAQQRELARLNRAMKSAGERDLQLVGEQLERLDGLAHWTAMSEATRSLLVRKREVDVFCRQIQTCIDEDDWTEAEQLILLFEEHFKDDELARKLRQQLSSARDIADDQDIRGRIAEVRSLIDDRNFPAAEMSLNRLAKDHPNDHRLDDLRATFMRARRRETEAGQQKFGALLSAGKLEQAAAVLDDLTWIDDEVVKQLREQWKSAFRQHQTEAKEQFRMACREKQWAKALTLGERILTRFADTSLAGEVRRVIDTVRQRAKEEADAHGAHNSHTPSSANNQTEK